MQIERKMTTFVASFGFLTFSDPRSFFVKDKDAEKQYKFSLERSVFFSFLGGETCKVEFSGSITSYLPVSRLQFGKMQI